MTEGPHHLHPRRGLTTICQPAPQLLPIRRPCDVERVAVTDTAMLGA